MYIFLAMATTLNYLLLQEDLKILIRNASSPKLLQDPSLLDGVLATEGWQTLMTFTRESARESRLAPLWWIH